MTLGPSAAGGPARKALGSYLNLDLIGKLEGADPHRLVALCYEELLQSLAATGAAMTSGAAAATRVQAARVQSILLALEGGLDFDRGGELASSLAAIYRAMRRELDQAIRDADLAKIDAVVEGVRSMSQAWRAIAR